MRNLIKPNPSNDISQIVCIFTNKATSNNHKHNDADFSQKVR